MFKKPYTVFAIIFFSFTVSIFDIKTALGVSFFDLEKQQQKGGIYDKVVNNRENEDQALNQISCEEYNSLGSLSFEEWKKIREAGIDTVKLAAKCKSTSNQIEQLYRNDQYHFRINFPAGWELKDGDGQHVTQKAVKDSSTILILVREFSDFLGETGKDSLSSKDISDLNSTEFNDLSDEETNAFLESIATGQLEAFPGSTILEKGIRYIDNRKAVYIKMNQVYKVQNIQVEGVSINYFTLHKGKLYQLGGFYPTVPVNESDKESAINTSLSTFVFEDWDNQSQEISVEKITGLETRVKQDFLNKFESRFVTGLFIAIITGLISIISLAYSKTKGKRMDNEVVAVPKIKRLANFSIDALLGINGILYLVAYLIIDNEWYGLLAYWWFFTIVSMFFYYLLFEWLFGRTLGKFITRTKVVTKNGFTPRLSQILERSITRLIPFEGLSFLREDSLGWHDKWSNTMVVSADYIPTNEAHFTRIKYCKECGNKIHIPATICNQCGEKLIK